jgi:hypothetical protein
MSQLKAVDLNGILFMKPDLDRHRRTVALNVVKA